MFRKLRKGFYLPIPMFYNQTTLNMTIFSQPTIDIQNYDKQTNIQTVNSQKHYANSEEVMVQKLYLYAEKSEHT